LTTYEINRKEKTVTMPRKSQHVTAYITASAITKMEMTRPYLERHIPATGSI
jgi:hypothetical protein